MIENTYISNTINRCHTTWIKNLGAADPYDRGRESDGTFKADDKTTPEVNEAWKSGKSPKKKKKEKRVRIENGKVVDDE
jgi:hypothetical protein